MSSGDPDPLPALSLPELRELAESAARVGGELARESFGRTQAVVLKADRSEVTETDVAAQRAIIAHLWAQRPDDTYIGEEAVGRRHEAPGVGRTSRPPVEHGRDARATPRNHEGNTAEGASAMRGGLGETPNPQSPIPNPQSICWIIDPIDGTRNYVRGVPLFACSVAAMRDGIPIAGAIYDPVGDMMYAADATTGARVNGKPLSYKPSAAFGPPGAADKLVVAIPSARRRRGRKLVRAVLDRHVVRNLGCTTLHLALVATGRFDAAVTNNSKLWDIAAGWLLVTQAGGVMTAHSGDELFPLDVSRYRGEEIPALAGTPAAHARLLRESSPD